jgi:hypothetical protein
MHDLICATSDLPHQRDGAQQFLFLRYIEDNDGREKLICPRPAAPRVQGCMIFLLSLLHASRPSVWSNEPGDVKRATKESENSCMCSGRMKQNHGFLGSIQIVVFSSPHQVCIRCFGWWIGTSRYYPFTLQHEMLNYCILICIVEDELKNIIHKQSMTSIEAQIKALYSVIPGTWSNLDRRFGP